MTDNPFPSKDDKLFTSPEDWWSTACVNWFHNGWSIYADGYKNAADVLCSHVMTGGQKNDTFVYPILFLYRQYLELAIKELIRKCRSLEDIQEQIPKTHRIDSLWPICHTLLVHICPGDSETELKEISRLINDFTDIDPTSTAFRYPEDNNGNPSLPGLRHINLRNLNTVMGKIYNLLNAADSQLYEYISIKSEMQCDYPSE